MIFHPGQFTTHSLRNAPQGHKICQVLAEALNQADAGRCVNQHLQLEGTKLNISSSSFDLTRYQDIHIIGVGKAAVPMTEAIYALLNERITSGILLTKEGYIRSGSLLPANRFEIYEAAHPLPDQRNLAATHKLATRMRNLKAEDLVVCVLSGGGSALLTKPCAGISLADLQKTFDVLLRSGASIDELNTVRKHLDELKGGGLARLFFPASVITLILSDVPGNHLDMVASGPTVADPTTFAQASKVLTKYQVVDQIPSPVVKHLADGEAGNIPETLKPGSHFLDGVKNFMVGSNPQAVSAAAQAARKLGFNTDIMPITLQGEASLAGRAIVEYARSVLPEKNKAGRPVCLIAGGETTVTIRGNGKGGRNQELVLGTVKPLSSGINMLLVSLATDGGDGSTDAAGAVATHQTYQRGLLNLLDPQDYLDQNDSYTYFEQIDDLLKTGPTLTNVNDLVFVFSI